MALRRVLLIPRVVADRRGAPKGGAKASWDHYWHDVTGEGPGAVLWDAASDREFAHALPYLDAHFPALPVLDVGCGNGSYSRALARRFPRVLGVDIAEDATVQARAESAGITNVAYMVLDATAADAGRKLVDEVGEANIFMRGVLHTMSRRARRAIITNLAQVLGHQGVLYSVETAYTGGRLRMLESLGASRDVLPLPIRRTVEAGLTPPKRFGERQYHRYFPAARWETLAAGSTAMYVVTMDGSDRATALPAHFAVLRQHRQ